MNESPTVELHITQHPGRRGWEVVKIAYDADNLADLRAVDAALVSLRAARHEPDRALTIMQPLGAA